MIDDPPLQPGRILGPAAALKYMLAGAARFTVVSPRTGTRHTYRVKAAPTSELKFVSLLVRPDNVHGYEYLGVIWPTGGFRLTPKSKFPLAAPPVAAFMFLLKELTQGQLRVEFWHEGRCGKCARALTVPSSIAAGLGPKCAGVTARAEQSELAF